VRTGGAGDLVKEDDAISLRDNWGGSGKKITEKHAEFPEGKLQVREVGVWRGGKGLKVN